MPIDFNDATKFLDDPAMLRRLAERDGYLFLRKYINEDVVLELRRKILDVLDSFGCLKPNGSRADDIINTDWLANTEDFCGSGVPKRIYTEIQRLEEFNSFPHNSRLTSFYESFLQAPVLVHPGLIGRIILPGGFATPPHQDFVHTKGSIHTWTCWVPLGNVERSLGSLSVLPGSNRNGVYPTKPKSNGGMETLLPENTHGWVGGDFEIGDLLVFSGLTVHKALPNLSGDRVRLSVDYRFQPVAEPISPNCLLPHGNGQSWDDIYSSWSQKHLQYYWKHRDIKIIGPESVAATID